MNLELLETFGDNYPEERDGDLDCVSIAITCAFNRYGALLAVGCNDGRIVIWDFMTRGIAKYINAHIHPVCSLCWSRDGQKLISASTDNTVSIWNVLDGECTQKFRFPSPILKVQFHPRDGRRFLVTPLKYAAVVMNVDGYYDVIPTDDDNDPNIVASFSRDGDYIYTGNGRGKILVFRSCDLELISSFRITASQTAVKQIEFARRGRCILVNSADRVIRLYDEDATLRLDGDVEAPALQKLQDLVNKTLWKKCCFSGDGEYVAAGSAKQHQIYIWERSNGNLVKILQGTKGELLLDVVWHPLRPTVCSISNGIVSVWSKNQIESWSAFAPDFKELDENVEYDERESEFDLEDEDKSDHDVAKAHKTDTEDEIDVVKIEPVPMLLSSDEETEDARALVFLPFAPEIEDPEEPAAPVDEPPPAAQFQLAPDKPKRKTGGLKSAASKQARIADVILPDAPVGETHPFLAGAKKNGAGNGSTVGSERSSVSGASGGAAAKKGAASSTSSGSYPAKLSTLGPVGHTHSSKHKSKKNRDPSWR